MADTTFRVADLVRSPALGLRLLAGADGLDRRVSWAHVSELPDPTPWLFGAEVIMTVGLALPRAAAAQRAYLSRLDDAGVAGLAVSVGLRVPPLHRSFLAEADRRGFPVLEVPLPVPFIAIAQEVAAAVQVDVRQQLGAQLRVFGALRWLATENLAAAELFDRLERLSGYTLFLCTPRHRELLPGVPVPPVEHAGLVPDSPDSAPALPGGGYVLPVPAPDGPAGYLLALTRPDARPTGLAVVQHIATVAALQVAMRRQDRETLRRHGAETLAELLQGGMDAGAAARRLAGVGIAEGAEVNLVVVRPAEGADPANSANAVDEAVAAALAQAGAPLLMLRRQRDVYALTPADPAVYAALAGLPGVAVGVSQPFAVLDTDPHIARREALWAVARAGDSGQPLVVYGADTAGRWLIEDSTALRALVDKVLGPALRYDAEHDAALVSSAMVWLDRDRRTDQAARALHVHPNTLSYRLRRFTELTGYDLAVTADLSEVWLALRAAGQLGVRLPGAR